MYHTDDILRMILNRMLCFWFTGCPKVETIPKLSFSKNDKTPFLFAVIIQVFAHQVKQSSLQELGQELTINKGHCSSIIFLKIQRSSKRGNFSQTQCLSMITTVSIFLFPDSTYITQYLDSQVCWKKILAEIAFEFVFYVLLFCVPNVCICVLMIRRIWFFLPDRITNIDLSNGYRTEYLPNYSV